MSVVVDSSVLVAALVDSGPDGLWAEAVLSRVWELRHSVTSYDAWYVALAEALGLPLATLDTRLSRVQGVACRFLIPGGA